MRVVASDFKTLYLPSLCAGRVIHRYRGDEEAEPTEFDKVLQELGRRHELQHLATLGSFVDLSGIPQEERFERTLAAIDSGSAAIYQPAFRITMMLDGVECEIVGYRCYEGKKDVVVVDFTNNAKAILKAFVKYRKGTPFEPEEPDKEQCVNFTRRF